MKKLLLILAGTAIGLGATFCKVSAQTYPYWDGSFELDTDGAYYGPMVADTNAAYCLTGPVNAPVSGVARWTKCGGWQDLNGLTVNGFGGSDFGGGSYPVMMAVHGHYLYAVGFFDGYANLVDNSDLIPGSDWSNCVQIARFDLATGQWSPLGQSFTATNVWVPTTVAVDSRNWIYVGFEIKSPVTNPMTGGAPDMAGQTIDMLDVSTNGGTNWECVGGGLVAMTAPPGDGETHVAEISALCADGTNLYIGGYFSGPPGESSPFVTMWTGTQMGQSSRCFESLVVACARRRRKCRQLYCRDWNQHLRSRIL